MSPIAEGFEIAKAFVKVSPDTADFAEQLKAAIEEATAGAEGTVKVGLDKAELDAGVDEAKAKLREIDGTEATAKLGLDKAGFDADSDEASAKLDEFGGREATAKLGLDKAEFDGGTEEARSDLDEFDGRTAAPSLDLDAGAFHSEKDDADARLDENDSRTATPKLDLDDTEFNAKLDEDEAKLRAAGSSSGSAGSGSLLGAITMGIGALTPGIGGAAAGLGMLGAVGATAFGGVAKALSAAHQSSQNLGQTGAQIASTQFANAVAAQQAAQQVAQAQQQQAHDEITSAAQIRQAEQSVTQARQQAAADAVSSAESIESAQMNVASAERQAATSEIQALQQVTQAQQGVEEANFALSQAQYQLSQAWEMAREQLTQLNDALNDSKLNTQAASLAVQQAEYNELLVNQNAYSTDLQREQATLAVAQAKQQLTDATHAQANAQYAADHAQQTSQQTIVQAQQQVTQATYGQQNAQTALADANRSVTQTQLNNAQAIKSAQLQLTEAEQQAAQTRQRDNQQIANAQQSLASAEEQAAYQRQQDAQAVAQAQQNLTNTLKQQQLQQAATASTANQAANQFAQDMARLTPAGRAFVNEVLSMKGAWKDFSSAIQEAVLPGATQLLKGLSTMFPELQAGAVKFGQQMGQAFASMGKTLATPGAHNVLQGLIDNGIQFAQIVIPAFDHFIGQLAELGAKQGAVKGLADILAGIFNGLAGFASGLAKYIPAFDQIGQAIGKIATALGPALAQDIGAVANALAPLARFLNSRTGGPFISGIAQVTAAIITLKGVMKLLPGFITDPLQKAAQKVGELLLSPFKSAASKLGGILGGAAKAGGSKLLSGVRSVMGNVASAVAEQAGKLPGLMSRAWSGIASGASALPGKLSGTWSAISAGASKVFGEGGAVPGMISGLKGAITGLPQMMSGVVDAIKGWGIWTKIASAATKVWTGIQAAFDVVMDANPIALVVIALAGLAVGIYEAYTHFKSFRDGVKEVFGALEASALWLWHDVFDPVWHGIEAGAQWLYDNGIKPNVQLIEGVFRDLANVGDWLWHSALQPAFSGIASVAEWLYDNGIRPPFQLIENLIHDLANVATWLWHNVFQPVFNGIKSGAQDFVAAFEGIWNRLQNIFRNPVNFLITTVYDNGIRRFWNDVVNAVGLKSLDLPNIPKLARGGIIPGYAPGRDSVPALLSPGESVLTPGATRELGAGTILALNARHQPGAGTTVKNGMVHASGGLLGTIEGLVGGVIDTGKIVAALATGNTTALANALGKFIGTNATAAGLAKVMVSIPKTLATDLVKQITGAFSGGGGPGGSLLKPTGSGATVQALMQSMAASVGWTGAQWTALNNVEMREAGYNLTAKNPSSGAYGLAQFINGPSEYAQYGGNLTARGQITAMLNYIKQRYGNPIAAWAHEQSAGWYDRGGPLPPGPTLAWNQTGRTEEVLTPDERQAWVSLVRRMLNQPRGGSGRGVTVVQQYNGTQLPTVEQQAIMNRNLALALSGA